ncbi:hypothetical protein GH741_02980 [Aquibacillus halophilus]|uniref:DUF4367 domain-containing protein n=1 Tax=Aquibacillus halophilus TaxID=930132 RepID=A0A6A8D7A7_9BACI|nr:hypothetical protein [Aquibacillus halophilus]MRH41635.1 hypothetical protein [Aquibacillus halophilus]
MKKNLLFMLLLFIIAFSGCSSSSTEGEFEDLEATISEKMEKDIAIIEFDDLELSFSMIMYDTEDNIKEASWDYEKFEDEKKLSLTEEETMQREKEFNSEFLYGPYEGGIPLIRTVVMDKEENLYNFEDEEFKEEQINEQTVYYYELKNPTHQITIFLPLDTVVYGSRFELSSGELNKETAFEYIEKLMEQTQGN